MLPSFESSDWVDEDNPSLHIELLLRWGQKNWKHQRKVYCFDKVEIWATLDDLRSRHNAFRFLEVGSLLGPEQDVLVCIWREGFSHWYKVRHKPILIFKIRKTRGLHLAISLPPHAKSKILLFRKVEVLSPAWSQNFWNYHHGDLSSWLLKKKQKGSWVWWILESLWPFQPLIQGSLPKWVVFVLLDTEFCC